MGSSLILPINKISEVKYKVDVFTSSGTWNKPNGLKYVYALVVSGGPGAGSGRRGAPGTNAAGGSVGGCSAMLFLFNEEDLSSSASVTVGAGGIGALPQTSDNTSGSVGSGGGSSFFNGYIVESLPSLSGSVNITTLSYWTVPSYTNISTSNLDKYFLALFNNVRVGTSSLIFRSLVMGQYSLTFGSGITTINPSNPVIIPLFSNISVGGQIRSTNVQENAGGVGGFVLDGVLRDERDKTAEGQAGADPEETFTFGQFFNLMWPWFDPLDCTENVGRNGSGGGPGDLDGTIPGGTGANGVGYGAAGGGGGASRNGANSGAGGDGTQGIVIVISIL